MKLETVMARTVEEPVTGCLLWTGKVGRTGIPVMGGFSVRRWLWEHRNGKLDYGMRVVAAVDGDRCHPQCVGHLEVWSCRRVGLSVVQPPPATNYVKRVEARMRHGLTKMTFALARQIRADPRSQMDIARDHGVSRSSVGRVKRNLSFVEHITGRSVFDLQPTGRKDQSNGKATHPGPAVQAQRARQGAPRQGPDGRRVRGNVRDDAGVRGVGLGGGQRA